MGFAALHPSYVLLTVSPHAAQNWQSAAKPIEPRYRQVFPVVLKMPLASACQWLDILAELVHACDEIVARAR